ncbi:MAG TPA: ABATE domain-containing protein [Bryobacteraceae bacterium]|nr:ABATE domain-containing protein [Bryobacteraceae bacterium]
MAKAFELVAGHVALDFVNTLDNRFLDWGPGELLGTYDDLLRFVVQSGLLTARQTKTLKGDREDALAQAKELREALARVAYQQVDGERLSAKPVETLEKYFREAAKHRHLTAEGLRTVWRWRGIEKNAAAPVWLLAQAAEDFLVSGDGARLRCCASDSCRWLFLDTSKNHTRRWCDMKVCGNRMKARRFYAKAR